MSGPPSLLIENYLREVGFWHVANIGQGCKLDPKLISAFIERWRPKMHTFHLPCEECTITLEDMQLQLRLPVDESVLTESVQSADWGAICYDLLSAIPNNIYGGRIEIGWLRDTFLESENDLTKVERIRYARAYILEIIGDYLMLDLSQNLIHLSQNQRLPITTTIMGSVSLSILRPLVNYPYIFPLITRWNHSASYVGIPTALEDIRLLLDQRSEVH
ncbi:hypothetical protein Goshw_028700, partial [Gossypium schwendimanii]|nr:hypothetical protein [Gossypium schwendimanii]